MRNRGPSAPILQFRDAGIFCLAVLALAAVLGWVGAEEPETRIQQLTPVPITDPAHAAESASEAGGEVFRLKWRLPGFLGFLANLFLPGSGEALLTFVPQPDERVEIQFLVTAKGRKGEFFLYGAEVDKKSGSPVAVWSRKKFRKKEKALEATIEDPQTIDFASAIYRLRWHPPDQTIPMTIWNKGRSYAAQVEPLGNSERRIGKERIPVRGYAIRGVKDGDSAAFDDKIWIYFSRDARAIPVEIVGTRGVFRARIQLADTADLERGPDDPVVHTQ